MCVCVVLTGQDPLRIDGKLAHECRDDFHQEQRLYYMIALVHKRLEFLGGDANRRRERVESARRLSRDDRTNALDDGFDVRLVDRLRQGSVPRWWKEKQADSSAIPMRRSLQSVE